MERSEYIRRSEKVHGKKYDYSEVPDYIDMGDNVRIGLDCEFYVQRVRRHLMGKRPEMGYRKKTTRGFILEARMKWGDRYDYSLTEYEGAHIPVKIIYDGVLYEQTPISHLGHAPEKRMSRGLFIIRSRKKWGDRYDYSQVEFVNMDTKVRIVDKNTGEVYDQTPNCHLRGVPRKIKRKDKRTINKNNIKFQTDDFIRLSKLRWGDLMYDYTETVFLDWKTPVKFKFQGAVVEQYPKRHFRESVVYDTGFGNYRSRCDVYYGDGCVYGTNDRVYRKRLMEVDISGERKKTYPMFHLGGIYGNGCDVSDVFTDRVYGGLYSVVGGPTSGQLRIRCPYHGVVDVPRRGFLMGDGCGRCRSDYDRTRVTKLLDRHGIGYVYDKLFTGGSTWMRFDLYLPETGTFIDCHGPQHTHPIERHGGVVVFDMMREDYITKKNYCEDNYQNYVIVRYDRPVSLSELTGLYS